MKNQTKALATIVVVIEVIFKKWNRVFLKAELSGKYKKVWENNVFYHYFCIKQGIFQDLLIIVVVVAVVVVTVVVVVVVVI